MRADSGAGRLAHLGGLGNGCRRPAGRQVAGASALFGAIAGLLVHQARLRVEVGRTARAARQAREQKEIAATNYSPVPAPRSSRFSPASMIRRLRNCLTLASSGATQAEKALVFYDRVLSAASSPDPLVQLDLARTTREAATIQYVAGRPQESIANLERSVRLIEAVAAVRPNDPEVIREEVKSRTKLGLLSWEVLQATNRAVSELRRLSLGGTPGKVRSEFGRSAFRARLVSARPGERFAGEPPQYRGFGEFSRTIFINRALVNELPADLRRRAVLAESLNNLGLLSIAENPEQAEAAFREAVTLLENTLRDNPARRWITSLASALSNWGNITARRGQSDLAFKRFKRGLKLVEEELKREPGDTILRYSAFEPSRITHESAGFSGPAWRGPRRLEPRHRAQRRASRSRRLSPFASWRCSGPTTTFAASPRLRSWPVTRAQKARLQAPISTISPAFLPWPPPPHATTIASMRPNANANGEGLCRKRPRLAQARPQPVFLTIPRIAIMHAAIRIWLRFTSMRNLRSSCR